MIGLDRGPANGRNRRCLVAWARLCEGRFATHHGHSSRQDAALLRRGAGGVGQHAERALVDVEQGFLLVEIVLVHPPDTNDLTHDPGVKAGALGLGVDLLDVGAERAPFLLEPLDPLDERAQPLAGNSSDIGHRSPYPMRACFGWDAAKAAFCSALASFWCSLRHSS